MPSTEIPPAAIYWGPDAGDFKPERFVDTEAYRWPRDACESLCMTTAHPG